MRNRWLIILSFPFLIVVNIFLCRKRICFETLENLKITKLFFVLYLQLEGWRTWNNLFERILNFLNSRILYFAESIVTFLSLETNWSSLDHDRLTIFTQLAIPRALRRQFCSQTGYSIRRICIISDFNWHVGLAVITNASSWTGRSRKYRNNAGYAVA